MLLDCCLLLNGCSSLFVGGGLFVIVADCLLFVVLMIGACCLAWVVCWCLSIVVGCSVVRACCSVFVVCCMLFGARCV